MRYRAAIVIASDSRSAGTNEDKTTTAIEGLLREAGFEIDEQVVVADEGGLISAKLTELADGKGLALIVTSGGTGLGPRDVTPEATAAVIEREVPGLAEAMRSLTAQGDPRSWLSRGRAGLRGKTLMVNLPGSPKGAEQCLKAIVELLPHAIEIAQGGGHE